MSLKMGPLVVSSYKDEWKAVMEQRYGSGNAPTSGPDSFDAWLSERVYSLQSDLNYAKAEREKAARSAASYKKQRNLAIVLCVIFFAAAMLFALRPAAAGKDTAPAEARAETAVSFAEWTRRQKAEYIASAESDKYHRRSCEYVENILDENRVYYDTAADAENSGKTACSLCRPHGLTLTQESTGKTWTSGG